MEICERIKKRRLEIGMTLSEEAEILGVAEATAQRYESGKIKTLKYETIIRLAEILKCTPAYLMGWEKDITWPKSSSGIVDIKDELESLLLRIESAKVVCENSELSDTSMTMLKNSLEGLLFNVQLMVKK